MNKIIKIYLWLRRKIISDEELINYYIKTGRSGYQPNKGRLDSNNPPRGRLVKNKGA